MSRRDPDHPATYVLSGGTRRALAAVVEDLRVEQEIVAKRFHIEASQEFADSGEGIGVVVALTTYLDAVQQIDQALRVDAALRNWPRE